MLNCFVSFTHGQHGKCVSLSLYVRARKRSIEIYYLIKTQHSSLKSNVKSWKTVLVVSDQIASHADADRFICDLNNEPMNSTFVFIHFVTNVYYLGI